MSAAAAVAGVTCPACRVVWVVPGRYAGRTVACRACGGPALARPAGGAPPPLGYARRAAGLLACVLAAAGAALAARLLRP